MLNFKKRSPVEGIFVKFENTSQAEVIFDKFEKIHYFFTYRGFVFLRVGRFVFPNGLSPAICVKVTRTVAR
jgi:hypothetical protein